MTTTFEGLVVGLISVLPGASYIFAYERQAGSFGVTFADRAVRFAAASAVFAAAFSGLGIHLYKTAVVTGHLQAGSISPWLFEGACLVYVVIPYGCGLLVGTGYKRRWQWSKLIIGDSPEPRAWDYLWRANRPGVVRVKLKSGSWLGGMYATLKSSDLASYAAGYPESQDLLMNPQLVVNPHTGEFERDLEGRVVMVAGGQALLLRWDEIEYLTFVEVSNK